MDDKINRIFGLKTNINKTKITDLIHCITDDYDGFVQRLGYR
jgi:hypothetical protein